VCYHQNLKIIQIGHILIPILENLLLKIVFFFFIFLFLLLFLFLYINYCLFKGLCNNLTSNISSILFDIANNEGQNGHTIVNCSFEYTKSTGEFPGGIGIFDSNLKYNITNCYFRNISNSNDNHRAGAINCEMNNNNGHYNISENTFIEIKTNKSVVMLNGTFSSLIFTYNSFYNVSSVYEGGVLKIIKYLYLFFYLLIYRQFILIIQRQHQ
jgi:hypothetical protein